VTAILILGAVVRAVAIGSRLHIDDAYSWYVATSPSWHELLRRLAANENSPPLFYLALGLVPGDGPGLLRIPAAVPGLLMSLVLYLALRRRLGEPVALASALVVAVAPFLITYSDLARGFMLADLALLVAMWGLLRARGTRSKAPWVTFVLAGAIACYTEYDSAIVVVAMAIAAIAIAGWQRWRVAAAAALVLGSMLPWIPEIVRAQDQVGKTKLSPMFAAPSVTGLRDLVVTLLFGENGGTTSAVGRWALFAVVWAAIVVLAAVARRRWEMIGASRAPAILLLTITAAVTLIGYAAAAAVGIDVFTQRYLTILVALAAPPALAVIAELGWRPALAVVAIALVGLGCVEIAKRNQAQYEPSFAPVAAAAAAVSPRSVLTNTPIVLYYLRGRHPRFDRPYNLGAGLGATCQRPCLIIDDTRVHGGTPRPPTGTPTLIGPYSLTLEK